MVPIWGKLGDLYGRRISFVAAIALFLIGSALCGMAHNMGELVGFRALQGLGAGGLIVGVLSIIGDMIPPRDRSKYQGVMMAVMPVAMIGGPLIGGFITDHLSWRWAFYVNLPLGIVTLVVSWITLARLPKGKGAARILWPHRLRRGAERPCRRARSRKPHAARARRQAAGADFPAPELDRAAHDPARARAARISG